MRNRKVFKSVAEIKKNPDIRLVFQKPAWSDFIDTQKFAEDIEANIGQAARQIVVNFSRRYAKADKAGREALALDVIQGMHGVQQLEIFDRKKKVRSPAAKLRRPAAQKPKAKRKAAKK